MKLDHVVTIRAEPALIALANRWLDLKGGMTKEQVEEVNDRLQAHAARLHDLGKDPLSAVQ